MTRHIICMLARGTRDNDLYESSGALFHKLACTDKQQSVLLLLFAGEDYRSWRSQPMRVLRSRNYRVGAPDDTGVALYINAHGVGEKIAGGDAGSVAAAIIEAIDLEETKIEKLVFLACSMTKPASFEPDMSKILAALERYSVWKIVLYTKPMTIFSPRNLKLREKIPAKGVEKKYVEHHFEVLTMLVVNFFADIRSATGNEQMVTAFYKRSIAGDEKLWDDPEADPRSAVEMPAKELPKATERMKTMIEEHQSEWGRRLVKPGQRFGFSNPVDSMRFEKSPFSFFQPDVGASRPNVSSPQDNLFGKVQYDAARAKVVWERSTPNPD